MEIPNCLVPQPHRFHTGDPRAVACYHMWVILDGSECLYFVSVGFCEGWPVNYHFIADASKISLPQTSPCAYLLQNMETAWVNVTTFIEASVTFSVSYKNAFTHNPFIMCIPLMNCFLPGKENPWNCWLSTKGNPHNFLLLQSTPAEWMLCSLKNDMFPILVYGLHTEY